MPWALPLLGPELFAGLALGFPEVVVIVGLLVLALTAKSWLEPLLASTATRKGGTIARIIDIPGSLIRGVAASAFSRVTHSISTAAMHRMHPLARWFHAAGSLVIGTSWAISRFAEDTAYSIEHLATVTLPREIHAATRPIGHRASKALAGALAAAAAARHLRRYLDRLYGHTIRPALHHLEHAVDVTIPRSLGRVGLRVRDVERTLTHPSTKWLRRTAAALWGAALLGLMVRTLARKFPWLFCRQVGNVGKRICGLDSSLLQSLLLDTLAIASVISVVEMAEVLQELEHEALVILHAGIKEMPSPDR